MAAIHGDDIIAEEEPEKLDRLDEILKQLVAVKKGAGQNQARSIRARTVDEGSAGGQQRQGVEWMEDSGQLAAIADNR